MVFHCCSKGEQELGYRTTAFEALQGVDLTGKTALVTGGNSGIGVETVRALASAGADCILCSRSVAAGQKVADALQPGVKGRISVRQLDLADLRSVAALGRDLATSLPSLDLLILNAGVMAVRPGPQHTADGFEAQFGINHLGHFYLTSLLLPKMKAQGTPARVVVVASSAHGFGKINLKDLNYDNRFYGGGWGSYGQSKLANILFTRELAKRLRKEGSAVEAFCLHPGIVKTNIGDDFGWRASAFYGCFGRFLKTPEQGAATTVYAATAAELKGRSGAYLQDCQVKEPAKHAQDDEMAAALWAKSEELIQEALKKAGIA